MHSLYNAELVPRDYHLFLCKANDLVDEESVSSEACANRLLLQLFVNRDRSFYESGTMTIHSKWQKVIEQNGTYLHISDNSNYNKKTFDSMQNQ